MKNNFESQIKSSLENYEAPYHPADWADMENRLDNSKAGKSSDLGKGLMIAASVIAVAGLIYYFSEGVLSDSANNSENKPVEKTIAADNTDLKNSSVQEIKSENPESGHQSSVIGEQSEADKTSQKENTSSNNKEEEKADIAENTSVNTTATNNPTTQVKTEPSPAPASLSATFHSNPTLVCAGTAVQFNADNAVPCTYRWEFGDGKTSGEKTPVHIYKNAGTYLVKLKLTETKQSRVLGTDEKQITLVVNPVSSVEIEYSATEYNPSEINFGVSLPVRQAGLHSGEARENDIAEYNWNFDDKQSSSEKTPVHNYSKKGNYLVTLIAKNSFGCSASDKKMVNIENLFPLAPNSFSPNGDNLNDTWIPASFKNGDYNFTLTVFDKNGNIVFKTSDKDKTWDGGSAKTGDVFIWKATVKNKNGKETNYNGSILIVE